MFSSGFFSNLATEPRLSLELIPQTSWFSNLRTTLTAEQWNLVRKDAYKKSNYKCKICGGVGEKHPVEAHEIWSYQINEEGRYVQKLTDVVALCPACHQVKHAGFANMNGHIDKVSERLTDLNNWDEEDTEEYMDAQFKIWEERSDIMWDMNTDWLVDHYGIVIKTLTKPYEDTPEYEALPTEILTLKPKAVAEKVVADLPQNKACKTVSAMDAIKKFFK